MKLAELPIDDRLVAIFKKQGIKELYPTQIEAINYVLNNQNLVLAIPTASGKTLVAYLAILNSVLKNKGKAMYIVPLRALATEKYIELKKFESLGLKIALSYGDLDSPETNLEDFDIIVITSEKADSLLRHKAEWLTELSVVIADEIHLIQDPSRGPTLEIILAKLRLLNPNIQIVALSASINNSQELASWLDAKHLRSDWRPVPLKKGIVEKGIIYFNDNTIKEIETHPKGDIYSIFLDTLKTKGQILIFVNKRRSAEALAEKLTSLKIRDYLEETKLKGLETKLIAIQSEPTTLGTRLAKLVARGVAFHHAGLSNVQRIFIEQNFKKGLIKCIVATPTLAWGINLPARRVIIKDTTRYDVSFGSIPLSVLEIAQMMGRAGRPQYDKYGEALLLAKSTYERERLWENYLERETEDIESKLDSDSALRTHILGAIASKVAEDNESLRKFLSKTFFVYQKVKSPLELQNIIKPILEFLQENQLIKEYKERLLATRFGKRVAELYIDPISGIILRDALRSVNKLVPTEFSYLHAIASTPDMPLLYPRRKDDDWLEEKLELCRQELLVKDENYEWSLAHLKTASMLEDWVTEHTEEYISKKYDLGPGDIHAKTETSEWLLYSFRELAKLFNPKVISKLGKLILRVRYGVKEELLELVALRGIGRVRARALFRAGLRDLKTLRIATLEKIASVEKIGLALAKSIKQQLS